MSKRIIFGTIEKRVFKGIKIQDALMFSQLIVVVFILWYTERLIVFNPNLGDSPSYLLFPFTPLSELLSSHRTLGLPLVLGIYNFFFENLYWWPFFQVLIYFSSILYLYKTLNLPQFSSYLPILICSGLLWNPATFSNFRYVETQALAATFHVLTIALLFRVVILGGKKYFSLLGLVIFFLWQIRPNMAIFLMLLPIWGFFSMILITRVNFRKSIYFSSKLFLLCLIPIVIWCSLRYFIVGNFGLASYSGTVSAGQAIGYLEQSHIPKLDGKVKTLAQEILVRKQNLDYPCNQFENITLEEADKCEGAYIMIGHLSTIYLDKNLEPFPNDPAKNRMPWLHGNLSSFFSMNNVFYNDWLKQFSRDIIKMEIKKFTDRLFYELKKALRFYFRLFFDHKIYLSLVVINFFVFTLTKFTSHMKIQSSDFIINDTEKSNRELVLFWIFTISMIFVGVLSIAGLLHLQPRYLLQFAFMLLSTLFLHALPSPSVRSLLRQKIKYFF